MVVGAKAAQVVDPAELSARSSTPVVQEAVLVEQPVGPPSALAPLSDSTQDQGVVEDAELVEAGQHAADLRVGVRQESGEDLHHAGGQTLARRRGRLDQAGIQPAAR